MKIIEIKAKPMKIYENLGIEQRATKVYIHKLPIHRNAAVCYMNLNRVHTSFWLSSVSPGVALRLGTVPWPDGSRKEGPLLELVDHKECPPD